MEVLFIFSVSCSSAEIPGLLAGLEALILHVVPLLLHVVGDVDLGHKNFLAARNLQLVIQLLLSNLCHLLVGSIIELSLLNDVVALALFQERLLLDTDKTKQVSLFGKQVCWGATYSRPSIDSVNFDHRQKFIDFISID